LDGGAVMTTERIDVLAVMDAQPLTFEAGNALARSLHVIGWELLSVEIDLSAETARIELRSGDRYVMFDARNGHASITRETMTKEQCRVGRKGDITVVDRVHPVFLGRQSGLGLRSGLRALSHYVADNAPLAIPHDQARDIFRPLLNPAALARVGGAS
jgi:hypothetical protein